MKHQVKLGQTDYTVIVFIPDPASTDGSGKTGLVAADLTVSYTRVETDNDVTVNDVTSSLNNLSALTDAHNDWGLKEVSSTLAPGFYRLDLADAVAASGAWSALVYVMITTSAAAASPMEFVLVPEAPIDGVKVVGLTASDVGSIKTKTDFLPSATAGAAGGVFIAGTNAATVVTTSFTTTFTGNLTGSVASVTGAVGSVTGLTASDVGAIKTKTDFLPSATAGAAGGVFIAGTNAATVVTTSFTTTFTGNLTGNVGGNVTGNVTGTLGGLTAAALKDFFDTDSGTTYASAVAGSVVKEIADNAGGATLTVQDIVDGVWDEDATGHQTQGTFGQAIGDPAADANTIYGAVVTGAAGSTVSADVIAVKSDTSAIKLKTDSLTFTVANKVDANTLAIDGSTAAADRLQQAAEGIVTGTVASATTTAVTISAISPSATVADQFKGRILIFDRATTTANLRGQASDITANTTGGSAVLTVTAFTDAAAAGDTFTIV